MDKLWTWVICQGQALSPPRRIHNSFEFPPPRSLAQRVPLNHGQHLRYHIAFAGHAYQKVRRSLICHFTHLITI